MAEQKDADRAEYLEDKINALVGKVDAGYGTILVEQLYERLAATTGDFENEIDNLVSRLKQNAATQGELLERIRKKELIKGLTEDVGPLDEEETTEWEKRLSRVEESSE